MEVFAVTIFVSLLLGILFAALFFAERSQRNRRGIEQIALLPLDDGEKSGERRAVSEELRRATALITHPAAPQHSPTLRSSLSHDH